MEHVSAEEAIQTRQLAAEQTAAYATRAGTPAWRDSVARSLRDGDIDRWAREVLRALGWAQPLPGARVYRRYQEDPGAPDPTIPFFPRGPDEHKLARLYEVEAAASPEAAYGIHVLRTDPEEHAAEVRDWCEHGGGDAPPRYFTVELQNPEARRAAH